MLVICDHLDYCTAIVWNKAFNFTAFAHDLSVWEMHLKLISILLVTARLSLFFPLYLVRSSVLAFSPRVMARC